MFRSRTIRRLNRSDRYNKELLEKVAATPWATAGVGKQPTPEWVLKGLPRAGSTDRQADADTKDSEEQGDHSQKDETKMDIDESQTALQTTSSSSAVATGPTTTTMVPAGLGTTMSVSSGIGDKRTEPSTGLSSSSSSGLPKLRKIQTVSSTTITPVEQVATKRGQQVKVETNEEDEMRLSDPLLGQHLLSEWPADKLQAGMQKEIGSTKNFGVYEETTADQLTLAALKGVINTR